MTQSHKVQQRTERRISAVLRLILVAILLAAQIALVFVMSYFLQQRMALAYALLELLALLTAVRIYSRPGSVSYKFGWILLILALPVMGLVLYFLWGGDTQRKRLDLRTLPPEPEPERLLLRSRENLADLEQRQPPRRRLAAYLQRQGFPLYSDTAVTYLPAGGALLEDMMEKLEQAQKFIFMEYYIIACGEIWQRMTEILCRKAAEGVEVRLIFDDFGSMMRITGEVLGELRRAGVEIIVFHPVHHYVSRLYFNYRDHRKITCIDGNIAYTGGTNIADEYAGIVRRFGDWKDCGVRLEGAGAWGLTREFMKQWRRLGGRVRQECDAYRPTQEREAEGFCQPFSDGPDNNPVSTAEETFLQLITGAQEQVTITTPYLAIDEPMMKALCVAGDSGVTVRLILPGRPDHKVAHLVAESYFGQLLRHNVQIYIYTPGMMHGKTVLCDSDTAFVGSVNMDYRSFQLHFECGTILYGVPAIADLARDLEESAAQSRAVTLAEWSRRPWYRKAAGMLLRLFAVWM